MCRHTILVEHILFFVFPVVMYLLFMLETVTILNFDMRAHQYLYTNGHMWLEHSVMEI
ncbi:hypothetical protein ES703_67402 [subsurface metagenome]